MNTPEQITKKAWLKGKSPALYRPKTKSGRGKGPQALRKAKEIAQQELEKALGLN